MLSAKYVNSNQRVNSFADMNRSGCVPNTYRVRDRRTKQQRLGLATTLLQATDRPRCCIDYGTYSIIRMGISPGL